MNATRTLPDGSPAELRDGGTGRKLAAVRDQVRRTPARQQPVWDAPDALIAATRELTSAASLVTAPELDDLREQLAEVAAGRLAVLQAGDCAEDPQECTPDHIGRKAALLDALAAVMSLHSGLRVLRVGRIAGQFGKPRSSPVEVVNGLELPVFRGHMVNCPEPEANLRRPEPGRLLIGYEAARKAAAVLRDRRERVAEAAVWTSHEALLLDYELPMLRLDPAGRVFLGSTHWPWVGDRTRTPDSAHVELLSTVANPVAAKVGPATTPAALLEVCARLDPGCEPGRLTLISRMGEANVARLLPPLVAAVRAAGHPVSWLCDPMHGNTITAGGGRKTRTLDAIVGEVRGFLEAVRVGGGVAGGLHLETTPAQVTECVPDESRVHEVSGHYTTFCDPRLNPEQAIAVAAVWGQAR